MKEIGILNSKLSALISNQGHGDMLMITDAGFAIPDSIDSVDISLTENQPKVIELLNELSKYFSVEKIFIAEEALQTNPNYAKELTSAFGKGVHTETISHKTLKEKSHHVKSVIRTGDFTAYANVILVSGAGDRWEFEYKKLKP